MKREFAVAICATLNTKVTATLAAEQLKDTGEFVLVVSPQRNEQELSVTAADLTKTITSIAAAAKLPLVTVKREDKEDKRRPIRVTYESMLRAINDGIVNAEPTKLTIK